MEYYQLQSLSLEEKVELIQKNIKYFFLFEKTSALETCVYCEEDLKQINAGIVTRSEMFDLTLTKHDERDIMRELGVTKTNSLEFIRSDL